MLNRVRVYKFEPETETSGCMIMIMISIILKIISKIVY